MTGASELLTGASELFQASSAPAATAASEASSFPSFDVLATDGSELDIAPTPRGQAVVAVLSDTHGYLPPEAFRALASLDPQLVVHAGDICGDDILPRLTMLAPVVAVLGNNDYSGEYGPRVRSRAEFSLLGVDFQVEHIRSRFTMIPTARIVVCGHTHVARVEQCGAATVVNPGSTTRPRGGEGASVAAITLEPGYVRSIRILRTADFAG